MNNLLNNGSAIGKIRQLAKHLIGYLYFLQFDYVRLVLDEKSSPCILSLAFSGASIGIDDE
ncbi:hypothetical protein PQU95_05080 [Vogesella sp. DC21W]|uniref:Uncharacterized protein n=1 Tax=Vogesella aquatica TaxID=2984206 RepID=A0ABT5IWB9_9NEIS|nr:hypothetical protein [Vogesella aquatica]MDC7716585.1 hypothetical protein [Vogesella aquatica]